MREKSFVGVVSCVTSLTECKNNERLIKYANQFCLCLNKCIDIKDTYDGIIISLVS